MQPEITTICNTKYDLFNLGSGQFGMALLAAAPAADGLPAHVTNSTDKDCLCVCKIGKKKDGLTESQGDATTPSGPGQIKIVEAPMDPEDGCFAASIGSQSTKIGVQMIQAHNAGGVDEDYNTYRNSVGCLSLPLKSGDYLGFSYNQFPGQGAVDMATPRFTSPSDIWQPAGRGGVFSFMPFFGTNDNETQRRMYLGSGSFLFTSDPINTGEWTLTPSNLPVYGTQDAGSPNEFTVWNQTTNTYFVYGGYDGTTKHANYGRILRIVDRNANTLEYFYDPTTKLATHLVGSNLPNVSVYFGYDAAATPPAACIRRVFLQDNIAPSQSRSIYFEYQDTTSIYFSYMTKVINPSGCSTTYNLVDADSSEPTSPTMYRYWMTAIDREMDADGFTSYFEYATDSGFYGSAPPNDNKMRMIKAVDPLGLVNYFNYTPGSTTGNQSQFIEAGRVGKQMAYDKTYAGLRASVPTVTQHLNALGQSSYFGYNADTLITSAVKARWEETADFKPFTTYYEYSPDIHLTRQVRVFDGAQTYFGWDPVNQTLLKDVGPRETAAFSTVSYFTYDSNRNRTSQLDALGNLSQWGYSSEGRITRLQDARGNVNYYNYDPNSGFADSMVDALGSVAYYGYNGFGNQTQAVAPRWQEVGSFQTFTTYYEYDQRGLQTKMIDPAGDTSFTEYTGRGSVALRVDPRGLITYYTYNGQKQPTMALTVQPTGTQQTVVRSGYNQYKNLVRTQDARDNTTYFEYDEINRRVKMIDAVNNQTYYGYDAAGNMVKLFDPRGNTSYYQFDPANRRVKMIDAVNNQSYYGYDLADNQVKMVDARGNQIYFEYDAINRRTVSIDALDQKMFTGYDAVSNVVRSLDARGNTTYFEYDAVNRRATTIDAANNTTRTGYDLGSNATQMLDARGNATYFGFDVLNRQSKILDATGNSMYYGYDENSNQTAVLDMRGNPAYFGYDALNRRAKTRDALGNSVYFGYDENSNLVKTRDARQNSTYFGFDVLNRRSTVLNAAGNSMYYAYDANSNMTATLDARKFPTYFGYDALNRRGATRDALGNSAYFGYDQNSKLVQVRDARQNSAYFGFDVLNRQSKMLDAVGSSMYYGYDENSNQTKILDMRGNPAYFGYDALNRRATTRDALGNSMYYGYDQTSNQTTMLDPRNNPAYFGYDALNRRAKTRDALGNSVYFGYDENSNLVKTRDARQNSTYFGFDALNRRAKTRDAVGNSVYFGYDENSNLVKTRNAQQNSTYFGFDVLNRRSKVLDAAGNSMYYAYDANSNLSTALDPRNFPAYFGYDGLNRRSATRDALANSTYFGYDQNSNMTAMLDPRDNTTYFEYDALNRRSRVLDAAGNRMLMGYDANSNATIMVDARGAITYFEFDAINRRSKAIDALGDTVSLGYDAASNLTRSLDPRSNPTYFGFDALNRRSALKDAVGSSIYFGYDQNSNLVKIRDMRQNSTYFGYDALDRRSKIRDAVGNVVYFGYDQNSNLAKTRDARLNSMYFGYDALDRRAKTRDALGYSTYFGYDPSSNLTAGLDARGFTTYFEYDAINRRSKLIDALNNQTYFGYDRTSNVVKLFDARSNSSYFEYDAINRRVRSVDPLGNAMAVGYDGNSNVVRTQDPLGNTAYFTYDVLNRLSTALDPTKGRVTLGYDAASNRTSMQDPLGHITYFGYEALNRMSTVLAPDGGAVYFGYDQNSNRLRETDPLLHTTYYEYDALNRVNKLVDPLGGEVTYAYDANSNLTNTTDQVGNTAAYGYDARNQMDAKGYSDGVTAYFAYDANFNRTTQVDGWGDTYYEYDELNRLTQKNYPFGIANRSFFGYDEVSNLVTYRYPKSTVWSIYYAYDDVNRMTREYSFIQSNYQTTYYEYDPTSNLTYLQRDDIACERTFDAANRLATASWYKGTTGYAYFEYDRSPGGRIDMITRNDLNAVIAYNYDDNDRLTQEQWFDAAGGGWGDAQWGDDPWGGGTGSAIYAFEYAYDVAGNRTHSYDSRVSAWTYYAYDNDNALTASWRNTAGYESYYTYDANGSCTQIWTPNGSTYFEYTAANLVKAIAVEGADTVEYDYDGDLNRYKRIANGATYFQFWENGRMMQEFHENQVRMQLAYGPSLSGVGGVADNDLIWISGVGTRHMLMDHRGSVIKVQNKVGTVSATREYNGFGETLAQTGTWLDEILFGYQSNWQTIGFKRPTAGGSALAGSLYLSPTRVYDTETGRFLQRDPIGNKAGMNQYAAFDCDPVNTVDPLGLWDIDYTSGEAILEPNDTWEDLLRRLNLCMPICCFISRLKELNKTGAGVAMAGFTSGQAVKLDPDWIQPLRLSAEQEQKNFLDAVNSLVFLREPSGHLTDTSRKLLATEAVQAYMKMRQESDPANTKNWTLTEAARRLETHLGNKGLYLTSNFVAHQVEIGAYDPPSPAVVSTLVRVGGGFRIVGGLAVLVASLGAEATWIGIPLGIAGAIWSGDQIGTGIRELWTGESQSSLGGMAMRGMLGDGFWGGAGEFGYDLLPALIAPVGTPGKLLGRLRLAESKGSKLSGWLAGNLDSSWLMKGAKWDSEYWKLDNAGKGLHTLGQGSHSDDFFRGIEKLVDLDEQIAGRTFSEFERRLSRGRWVAEITGPAKYGPFFYTSLNSWRAFTPRMLATGPDAAFRRYSFWTVSGWISGVGAWNQLRGPVVEWELLPGKGKPPGAVPQNPPAGGLSPDLIQQLANSGQQTYYLPLAVIQNN